MGEDYYTNQCDGKLYNGRNCNDPNTKNITNTNTIKNTNTKTMKNTNTKSIKNTNAKTKTITRINSMESNTMGEVGAAMIKETSQKCKNQEYKNKNLISNSSTTHSVTP